MKKIVLALLLFQVSAHTQPTGTWKMPDGSTIHRPNYTTQIETNGVQIDTFKVKWITPTQYQVIGQTILTVTITKVFGNGDYTGLVTDGKRKKYFEAKTIN